jgi:exoribonuclease-2
MNFQPVAGHAQLQGIARRAMKTRGLEPEFPPRALSEAQSARPLPHEAAPDLQDLRGLLWCSIDNDDSRDLDQLSVSTPGKNGGTNILVAIADVDALVRKGSAVDDHARSNTTSVYTAAEIFPMLPERYSTDLTSLGESQERPSLVVEMSVGQDGALTSSQVYRAWVLNRAKLAYNGVAAWLEGGGPPPPRVAAVPGMEEQLRVQDRVAQAMKKLRHEHGALVLRTIEAKAVFRGDLLADLLPEEKNRAKELIEDFMIAANGVTAKFLESRGFPSIRRVLQAPERWDRIMKLAADYKDRLPDAPSARALQEFLIRRQQADPVRFPDLSLSVIKLLGSGEYTMDLPGQKVEGHFGLAVTAYTHSTAPNRRFPDLITQRLLKAALERKPPPYSADELRGLARHCTDQENSAQKVERQVRKSSAALLLAPRIGERFDAIVTGVSDKGTWVRTLRPPVEGKVVKGVEGLDVGDQVSVQLLKTDVEQGFIDFARA